MTMTFGELVKSQMELEPSSDLVNAANYEIPFGKHKGMTLSLLMEQQHSYCMWLINQEESKNPNFNQTCENIKILLAADQAEVEGGLMIDGVEVVAGEPVVIGVDPAKDHNTNIVVEDLSENKPTGNSYEIANGLLMGKLSDILAQVSEGEISFEFGEADIDSWLMMVKELDKGIDAFVIIETKHSKDSNNQRIKKIIPQVMTLKAKKGVLANA